MFRVTQKIPRKVAVAVSGGCDSMAVLDFIRRSHEVLVLHVNHGTPFANQAQTVVEEYCKTHDLKLTVGSISKPIPKGESLENFWRICRYDFFESSNQGLKVITCHHLNDVMETWVFSSLHGNPQLIPGVRDIYIRPFLTNEKDVFYDWCKRKGVPYIEDPSNEETRFIRNYIRHELLPKALHVNPGLGKTLKKKILSSGST